VSFEQATIRVEREQQFATLQAAIRRVFAAESVEKFLGKVRGEGLRIRDFDHVLKARLLETVDAELRSSGTTGEQLYQALSVTDQGQMREFYLTQIEGVAQPLRHKFSNIYQYY
jgi:phenylacetate-coenzyme A ligase PaaK-like adenylate-forming protein